MTSQDKLERLFEMQAKLNDYVFKKRNIRNVDGQQLTMFGLLDEADKQLDLTSNGDTNTWLMRYLKALLEEGKEVEELLHWKFWSSSMLDLPHIQEEIIDILHFWISLALVSGMDADTVFTKYIEKNQVNIERQDNNYVAKSG